MSSALITPYEMQYVPVTKWSLVYRYYASYVTLV